MKSDKGAIQRTRNVRHRISEILNHDPQKVVDYYMELQKGYADRLVFQTNAKNSWNVFNLEIAEQVTPADR